MGPCTGKQTSITQASWRRGWGGWRSVWGCCFLRKLELGCCSLPIKLLVPQRGCWELEATAHATPQSSQTRLWTAHGHAKTKDNGDNGTLLTQRP